MSTQPAKRASVRSPIIVAVSALLVALVVLPEIAHARDIEEGALADVLWLLQVALIVAALVALAMAGRRWRRGSSTAGSGT